MLRIAQTPTLAAVLFLSFASANAQAAPSCQLGREPGSVRHVVYIQFDNTHLRRDKPAVPSDLEQMPHLLDFIRSQGTMLTNDHTVLISHTAGGILSSLTGVYPDRHGQTVSNSYVRTSATGSFSFPSSFGYWTDPVSGSIPNMVTPTGANAPAPWVPYTRAGCDVGAVGTANIELENTGTWPTGDITKVFGVGSPQYAEALASNNAPDSQPALQNLAQTDFVGIAIHCAAGSSLCASGRDDLLPAEPGGYNGFKGLFGAQEVNPALTGGPVVNDMGGHAITDPFGQPGFPGFDGLEATVSLGYLAAMLEKGVQVTFAYISDAHENHVTGVPYAPGEAGYVAHLKAYDEAFAAFFERLADDGINKDNTLFVFTVDEGDHFVGGQPTPSTCDGVNVPCVWGPFGEVDVNIDTLVTNQFPALANQFLGPTSPYAFTVHGDDAPTFYLAHYGVGPLGQTDPVTRSFERQIATVTAVNPYTGNQERLLAQMADHAGMKALHMLTSGDPARNATFVFFGDPDYYITDYPSSTCATCIDPFFAWNHGDIQPEIAHTWIGYVGPGIRNLGTASPWTDHTDVRPTMLSVLGLRDPYELDGRVVTEVLHSHARARSLDEHRELVEELGERYKQLNAPFGRFGKEVLRASTVALAGDDDTYARLERRIERLTERRDDLAAKIKRALNAAAFEGVALKPWEARAWMDEAQELLEEASELGRR